MSIADLRRHYSRATLLESDAADHPLTQFARWFDEAVHAEVPEPNAMTLATVDTDGRPSARIVLLKGYDEQGYTFFTNYTSRKGTALGANPHAALLFFWPELERQVRIEGDVAPVSGEESDTYYHSRPLGSRIGAWVSPQSQPISRDALQAREHALTLELGDQPARPPHWGGYRLTPNAIEFWQGRPSRLHDRLRYQLQDDSWTLVRLAP